MCALRNKRSEAKFYPILVAPSLSDVWHLKLNVSQAALNILSHTPAYSSMEATSLLSHQGQKPGNHQTCVTVQGRQDSCVISMSVAGITESGLLLTEKRSGKEHCIQEGRCWACGHVDFKVLAGHPGGDFQQSVGNDTVHDRLLVSVTEMKAQELFWKVEAVVWQESYCF